MACTSTAAGLDAAAGAGVGVGVLPVGVRLGLPVDMMDLILDRLLLDRLVDGLDG